MVKPIFKTLIHRKAAIIPLVFSAFPLLLILVGIFKTNFMQLSAPSGSMSFIDFFSAVTDVQFQSALPMIAFIYLVVVFVNDEISSGIMYLFKDISRTKILNAKLLSILFFYYLYFLLTLFFSLITYYCYLISKPYTSGKLLSNATVTHGDIVSILGFFLMSQLVILLAFAFSIRFKNGITLILSTVFLLVSFMAPHLKTLRYFFPNGYDNMYRTIGFGITILIILGIFIGYSVVLYIFSHYEFKRIEY